MTHKKTTLDKRGQEGKAILEKSPIESLGKRLKRLTEEKGKLRKRIKINNK